MKHSGISSQTGVSYVSKAYEKLKFCIHTRQTDRNIRVSGETCERGIIKRKGNNNMTLMLF